MKTKLLLALGIAAASLARSETYQLDWFTIDGGGGTSRDGAYSLSGTIGQPDAATIRANGYILEGGFWPAFISEGTNTLNLQIRPALNNQLIVAWSVYHPGYTLEAAVELPTTNWVAVPQSPYVSGAEYNVLLPANQVQRYFRLRKSQP